MEHFGASVHLLHGMCAYYVFLYARLVGASACVCIHHAGMHQILHMWVVTHHPQNGTFRVVRTTSQSMCGYYVFLYARLVCTTARASTDARHAHNVPICGW
jgi:hypothetical protein